MFKVGDKVCIKKCKELKYLVGTESEIKEIIFDERNKPFGVEVYLDAYPCNIFFEESELKLVK